jgi:ribonuclease HI
VKCGRRHHAFVGNFDAHYKFGGLKDPLVAQRAETIMRITKTLGGLAKTLVGFSAPFFTHAVLTWYEEGELVGDHDDNDGEHASHCIASLSFGAEAVFQIMAGKGRDEYAPFCRRLDLHFNFANLHLLPKTFSDIISNTRPLSVTNCDNRIIAKLLVGALSEPIASLVDKTQKGFLKGRSGSDHIRLINELYYGHMEKGTPFYILFLDIMKAFDSVDHSFIIALLKHIGMPTWVVIIMKALLNHIWVTPVVGGDEGGWIHILRGVKQGCPLSPLIFILVYDVLITRLNSAATDTSGVRSEVFPDFGGVGGSLVEAVEEKALEREGEANTKVNVFFAFADDILQGTTDLDCFSFTMSEIDRFGKIAGPRAHQGKTLIVTSTKDDPLPVSWAVTCPWPEVKTANKGRHLGVLVGNNISTKEVFESAFTEFQKRVVSYTPLLARLTLPKRIITINVFALSVFSYLIQFYMMPSELIHNIQRVIAKAIITFKGKAFSYINLVAPLRWFGFKQPIRDPWVVNSARLLAEVDLTKYQGAGPFKVNGDIHSLRMLEHIKAAVGDLLVLAVPREPGGFDAQKFRSRRKTYDMILDAGYKKARHKDLVRKLGLAKVSNPDDKARRIARMGLGISPNMPSHAISTQLMIILNAVTTDVRLKRAKPQPRRGEDPDNPWPCYCCGAGSDRISHIFGDCIVICAARSAFQKAIKVSLSLESTKAADPFHLSLLSTQKDLSPCQVNAVIVFNWAVWLTRVKFLSKLAFPPSPLEASSRINNLAVSTWHTHRLGSPRPEKGTGSAGKRSEAQRKAVSAVTLAELNSLPGDALVGFSDGSSLGNPGPCGAGATIKVPGHGLREDIVAPLGRGTNNFGELWAIGMVLNYAELHLASGNFKSVHIFSDSQYSIGCLSKGFKSIENRDLVMGVKTVLRSFPPGFVEFHYTPGHADVEGNNRADKLAVRGSTASRDGRSIGALASRIATGNFLPP